VIAVLNKIDAIPAAEREATLQALQVTFADAVPVSAVTREGLGQLALRVRAVLGVTPVLIGAWLQ
jgi:50S ribosomal subunit-associated GTPase HflX